MTALMVSTDSLYRIFFLCLLTIPRPRVDLNVFRDEIERQDESLPPIIPTIVRHYKSGDTDTGKNAGENKSEDKDKCKDTGELKDSEDL
jgi:hypothetical protein